MGVRPSCLLLSLLVSSGVGGGAPAAADSFFPLDLPVMAEHACALQHHRNPGKTLAQCHVKVRNGGGHNSLDSTASFVRFSSAAVATSCGLWDVSLTLAPGRLQPVLEMKTILHFASRETGQTADFELRPRSGLAGPWVLTTAGKSPIFHADTDDDEVEVLTFEGCIPAWVFKDPDLEVDESESCEVCPEEDEETDEQRSLRDLDQPIR